MEIRVERRLLMEKILRARSEKTTSWSLDAIPAPTLRVLLADVSSTGLPDLVEHRDTRNALQARWAFRGRARGSPATLHSKTPRDATAPLHVGGGAVEVRPFFLYHGDG